MKDPAAQDPRFVIAATAELKDRANELLRQAYSQAGFGEGHSVIHDEQHTPFVVQLGDQVFGTLTLAVDSPQGLAVDRTFPVEVATLRNSGARLCELTKFAFDIAATRQVLAGLFATIFRHGIDRHRCTDLLIEVNPLHQRFYERQLGFVPISAQRHNNRVNAPAILMRLEIVDVTRQIIGHATGGLFADRQARS